MWKYPYMDLKDDIDHQYRVRDAMSKDLIVLTMHGHTVETLMEQIRVCTYLLRFRRPAGHSQRAVAGTG